jgi:hypothetical protein
MKKSELRGRFLNGKNHEVELKGETYVLAPISLKLRTELLAKLPIEMQKMTDPRADQMGLIWNVGGEIIFRCLLAEKDDGSGYERAFLENDRETFFGSGTSQLILDLGPHAFNLLFGSVTRKEDVAAMGKASNGTGTSTSSSTTSASTDGSSTPAAS